MNLDQGLGFNIMGTVVDKRKLMQIFIALVSTLPPVLATVVAMRSNNNKSSACSLNTEQANAFQSVAAAINATCAFNITVSANGVKQWYK